MAYSLTLPSHLLEVEELNLFDCVLLASLLQLSSKYGYCFATNNYLAKQLKSSIPTINRELAKLKELGYLTTTIIYKPNSKEIDQRQIRLLNKVVNFIESQGPFDPSKVSDKEQIRSEQYASKWDSEICLNEQQARYR
jgi:hypothetical protein